MKELTFVAGDIDAAVNCGYAVEAPCLICGSQDSHDGFKTAEMIFGGRAAFSLRAV